MLTTRRGWQVPEIDAMALDIILREVNDLQQILPRCSDYRTCVQAGGNIGIWPKTLSGRFSRVFTAEPDHANYSALIANLEGVENIEIIKGAFGDQPGTGSMDHIDPTNIGAHQVQEGTDFEILTIDSLKLDDVDLLQLDVEGFEHQAILGALDTIQKSWPVIVLELKGLGERYGFSDEETIRLLEGFGYKIADRIHRDVIFTRR